MKELDIAATPENVPEVVSFVDQQIKEEGFSKKARMQIAIAVEEVFVNIAHYAYNPVTGPAMIRVDMKKDPLRVELTFIDHGVAYDPLSREDPDVTLSAEDRQIGGLGIFMVKKSMDDISYEYKDGHNILTFTKELK